ncbi:diphthamide biosynthesis protein [Gloeophyllum trabeum ATCC 11539]|uniref:2-(3-amino-3-carboxypropyl)histidine synthase subunit 2 n=1 Tax=Gloeophyllum trabeum (strain ATCC 11539 / FP-39264 / Madison 617) TaxID=670483 RepID=S7Q006_GLOTA|nr:diphthamide biosynthesis protein [Gloeophyllum trabeum ATCC 11539]EPQ53261.1 diphthamide biosynthesis protein [Gloeophyllum trabeum ATCC 11539]
MSATAFAPTGEEVITRAIEVKPETSTPDYRSADEFREYYEIPRTATEIIQGSFKRIALQFPDELLHDSVPIYRHLKSDLEAAAGSEAAPELYVLADTSYGRFDSLDNEVAAQHVDADLIVHHGHACMSKTYRMPVIYVFGKKTLDVEDCVSKLAECISSKDQPKRVVLRHDVAYSHVAGHVINRLRGALPGVTIEYSRIPLRLDPSPHKPNAVAPSSEATLANTEDGDGADAFDQDNNPLILYIGGESLGLTNLLMTHASSEVYSYNPETRSTRLESGRANRLLMRRYATVQKARDADVFGILVGTLGVASYLPLISHLRSLLSRSRKKSYTISVGKLNPAKLANFMEIECFVLVACPENSLIESKEFMKPIVTPFELEIALKSEQSWTGKYVLDFERLLAEHDNEVPEETADQREDDSEDPDQPIFSTITGKYRTARRFGGADADSPQVEGGTPSAVVLRNQDNTVATLSDSAAAEFLQSRSFRGLETRLGEDAPSVLEQGRSGIARGYANDKAE